MKHGEWVAAVLGALLLGLGCFLLALSRQSQTDFLLHTAEGCNVPIRRLNPAPRHRGASAVIFHGLSANRRTMQPLGQWLAAMGMRVFLVDHPGHGDNRQPFTFAQTEACASSVLEALERKGEVKLGETILVGHSMGAAVAIRLADRFPTAATISISTAMAMPSREKPAALLPLEFPRRVPINLLLFTAEYDLPRNKQVSRQLVQAAGGERFGDEDFRQKRAVRWLTIPRSSHTSLIFDHAVWSRIESWNLEVFGNGVAKAMSHFGWPLSGTLAGLVGLGMIFPAVARLFAGRPRLETVKASRASNAPGRVFLAWTAAGALAAAAQYKFVPLGPILHIYSGDYLASFLLLVGVGLLLWLRKSGARHAVPLPTPFSWRAVVTGTLLGLATMLAVGAWLDWQLTDAWLNGPRWWRFALLVPLLLPYFLAEEWAPGVPTPRRGRTKENKSLASEEADYSRLYGLQRLGLFAALRLVLWLALLFGVLALRSGEVLMLLLGTYMAVFTVAQRLGMDAVRRRTGSAGAAAVFGAILAAWFIAAVFPIT